MSTVIKAGTIVTSDLTYKSDVLVENGKISSIGKNISGDKVIDASGLLYYARRYSNGCRFFTCLHQINTLIQNKILV